VVLGRDDAILIPAVHLLVIVEIKVVLNGGIGEQVRVQVDDLCGDLGGFAEVGFGFFVLGFENVGSSEILKFAVAVAPAGRLCDGIEPGEGPVDDGEVDINAGFDELSRDQADGEARGKAVTDLIELPATMLRAHESRKVEVGFAGAQFLVEFLSMLAAIDDTEHLSLAFDSAHQVRIG